MFQCQEFHLTYLLYIFPIFYIFLSLSSSISSNSPSIKFFFSVSLSSFLNLSKNLSNKKFLEIGKIKKNPKISVAKPGIINNREAKTIAAPDIISLVGALFFLIWI